MITPTDPIAGESRVSSGSFQTTNLALPLSNRVNLGTIGNVSPGSYTFNSQPITNLQEFYRVVWPQVREK
jgi:hypothetical protein